MANRRNKPVIVFVANEKKRRGLAKGSKNPETNEKAIPRIPLSPPSNKSITSMHV
jgi:hypothetical protein